MTPDQVKDSLSGDQYKLYKLVWERFIASQMATALLDTVSVDIRSGEYLFKASGYTVKFDGYTVLYEESKEEAASGEESASGALPALEKGDLLKLKSLESSQHFTQPPPRFTEASLIKTLEENGIGRPSTYAPTITPILSRGYVEREAKALKPTALGEVVTQLMKDQFKKIVDVDFTAQMEKNLDEVEEGATDWVDTLSTFYEDFAATLSQAEKNMDGTRVKVPDEETDEICELCGRKMVIKTGRFGKFLACPGFPECKNTRKIVQDTGGVCPLCGGKVLAKKSKKGKAYYGCEHNPKCGFMTWDTPLKEVCPKCGAKRPTDIAAPKPAYTAGSAYTSESAYAPRSAYTPDSAYAPKPARTPDPAHSPDSAYAPPAVSYCKRCGKPIAYGTKLCRECRAALEAAKRASTSAPPRYASDETIAERKAGTSAETPRIKKTFKTPTSLD